MSNTAYTSTAEWMRALLGPRWREKVSAALNEVAGNLRWDRRERGETPETFVAFAATIAEQQLEIDRFKRKAEAVDEAVDMLNGCLGQKAMPDERFDQSIEAFIRKHGGLR